MIKENLLRKRINENGTTLGTRISGTWPVFTEEVGVSGNFDYIEFLAEYSPYTGYDLENIARAAELHNMASIIKVDFQNRAFAAQKAVCSGFQGILFADHTYVDEFKETVEAMKPQTPEAGGRFGYPGRRFIGYQPNLDQMQHAQRLDDIVLMFMIEKKQAVEDIEEICQIPGVDMVQFGSSDYSMSMGWLKSEHTQELKEIGDHVIRTALKYGVRPRVELYGEPEDMKRYAEMGVKDFIFGDQMGVYRKFLNGKGSVMRGYVNEIK